MTGEFHLRLEGLVSRCKFHGLQFELTMEEGGRWFLVVVKKPWNGRKWRLSPYMTDTEIVQTALKAVLTWVEHETREEFTFDGEAVYSPHFNVHDLVRLAKSTPPDARK